FRGPNYKNVDFAITKDTRLTERVKFIFRAEFYNAFNLHMFINDGNFTIAGGNAFDTDISSSTFGQWTGNVSAPRRIQLGARFEFEQAVNLNIPNGQRLDDESGRCFFLMAFGSSIEHELAVVALSLRVLR